MISFSYANSLESPFRKILNNIMKHEEEDFECPILSNTCPFLQKQLLKKIVLGQQEPKEFMDEIMETVILDLDLNKPQEIKKPSFVKYSLYSLIQNSLEGIMLNNIISFMTGIFLILDMIFVMNCTFGIGNLTLHLL